MESVEKLDLKGLGRLCDNPGESGILAGSALPGVSRIGARFYGNAYSPHRHDTYSIGFTVSGVQKFSYRGTTHASQPGNVIVLHPDEVHDGGAGTEEGLVYRMLYLEPAALQRALDAPTTPLPFVSAPVLSDPSLRHALFSALGNLSAGIDDLAFTQLIADIADGLQRHARAPSKRPGILDTRNTELARQYLEDNLAHSVTSRDLEKIAGMDRFALARHFRALYATSPHRYLTMRRLERAKTLILSRNPIAEVAATVGFSDQSHLNRHFKRAFGLTPGAWGRLASAI